MCLLDYIVAPIRNPEYASIINRLEKVSSLNSVSLGHTDFHKTVRLGCTEKNCDIVFFASAWQLGFSRGTVIHHHTRPTTRVRNGATISQCQISDSDFCHQFFVPHASGRKFLASKMKMAESDLKRWIRLSSHNYYSGYCSQRKVEQKPKGRCLCTFG